MKKVGVATVAIVSAMLFSGATSAQNVAAGQEVFQARCSGCHTSNDGGANKTGPNLFGVFDSDAGSRAVGFRFSSALSGSGVTWDEASLDSWLASPRGFISGNRMSFGGLSSGTDRADITAFLATLK